eukprot:scaffold56207_cov62-Phaeocystis_antarctica.AAC.1
MRVERSPDARRGRHPSPCAPLLRIALHWCSTQHSLKSAAPNSEAAAGPGGLHEEAGAMTKTSASSATPRPRAKQEAP